MRQPAASGPRPSTCGTREGGKQVLTPDASPVAGAWARRQGGLRQLQKWETTQCVCPHPGAPGQH